MPKKREYCVGVKIINCFYVEAEDREEAELIVREMDNDEILLDSDFNIELEPASHTFEVILPIWQKTWAQFVLGLIVLLIGGVRSTSLAT